MARRLTALRKATPFALVASASEPSFIDRELRLFRQDIREGRFERSMALMTAFAAVVTGFEAYAQHLRGAFRHWLMWTPIWLTGPTIVAATAAMFSRRAAHAVLPVLSAISLLDGIVGFIFHIRGVTRMPGGFRIGQYNVVMGPPLFAPLLVCIIGVMGGLAGFLRREWLRPPGPLELLRAIASDAVARRGPPRPPWGSFATEIARGRFQRGMALTTATFAVLAGGEAYFEHLRGSFSRRLMWTPVWVTPPMVVAAVAAAASERVAHRVLPIASAVTFLDGLLGFLLHLQGIQRMPGGFQNLRFNFTMGPPLFAPLLFSSVGILGVIASLLRRPRSRR